MEAALVPTCTTISALSMMGTGKLSSGPNSPSTMTMPLCLTRTSKLLARRRASSAPMSPCFCPCMVVTAKPCGTWRTTSLSAHSWRATCSRLAPRATPRRWATPYSVWQASTTSTSLPARASEAPRLTSMAPLSSCWQADRKVTMRGRGPASMRRRPSAWSKSKLAMRHLAQTLRQGAGLGHHQGQIAVFELAGAVAGQAEGAVDQHGAVGQVQVFRHALAVGDIEQAQFLADDDVEYVADRGRLIHLGHDAAGQAAALVGAHHFIQGLGGRRLVQAQQALHVGARLAQHGNLFGDHLVALGHADRVDQHGVLVAQFFQGDAQVRLILDGVHHHAEDLAVDAQLLVAADTIGVGGDQGQLLGAVAHHAAGGQFGRAGGLAHASGT